MAKVTDRGIAFLRLDAQGRQTVLVCSEVRDGRPVDVFASHIGPHAVRVHPGVQLVGQPDARHTSAMVWVTLDPNGVVHVRQPTAGRNDPT